MNAAVLPAEISPQGENSAWASQLGALGLCIILVLALFFRDWADMAKMWWGVSTYQHCLFILPISGWLIAQRRPEMLAFRPKAWWPGLVAVFGASTLWMLGEAGGVALFRHLGVVLIVQSLVLTLMGPTITRAILFPLSYLIFLVPMGEELAPVLQTITAKLTIWFMGLSAIPHQVNGVLITTPNGYFEVAEACSGVKFLIAMIAYGALVCNVCFSSWRRRAAFMAASIIVPVLANGFRAFATIWIASAIDRDFAKSFDHVVYGWFFFAIVLIIIMAMGWRFFDRKVGDPWIADMKAETGEARAPAPGLALAALLVMAAPVGWLAAIASSGQKPLPNAIALPEVSGWARVAPADTKPWSPHFAGADHMIRGTYRNATGREVDLAVALFGWQAEGRELVGYGQGARGPESDWAWASESARPRIGAAERITAPGPVSREVVTIYVAGGKATGSAMQVKLETLKTKLLGGDQAAAAIIVTAEERAGLPARVAVDQFLSALGQPEQLAQNLIAEAR